MIEFAATPSLLVAQASTVEELIALYQSDALSGYKRVRYASRRHYDTLCRRLVSDIGHVPVADIRYRHFLAWHEHWTKTSGVSMAHALVGMVRTIVNFGATILESSDCERLAVILHRTKFKMAPPRSERLTAEQAEEIRELAHDFRNRSIALAQAFQFECILRQKDVLGEWVPLDEPGESDVIDHARGLKWLRGIRWSEIDGNLILVHVTSKRQKEITVDLKLAPMVMVELAMIRPTIPTDGPIIVNEKTGLPWHASEFRRIWRQIADGCGIPKQVRNMDTRSGAISEATDAGADLESVRHAATHSDIAMTQRYSRGSTEKIANVQRIRAEHRAKGEGE